MINARSLVILSTGVGLAGLEISTRRKPADSEPPQLPNLFESAVNKITEPDAPPVLDANDARAQRSNLQPFLDAIAWAEGTSGPDGYRTLFGGGLFERFDDHPAELGWPGRTLPDDQCRAAGFGPGCVSTAAGRYQITRSTWRVLKSRLSLANFGPQSQDNAAAELIRENGALPYVLAGQFDTAVEKVRRVWASLPGAGYAQPERSADALRLAYINAGGTVA